MRKLNVLYVLATVLLLAVAVMPVLAHQERFESVADGLVVRHPQRAKVGKNFNIGIYVADSLVETSSGDGSEGDYDLAELYISVSGPEGSICIMWNDWFEYLGETIGSEDDLIVAPHEVLVDPDPEVSGDEYTIYIYSMEYDESVSKLGDVVGWTGSVVCNADTPGIYTFTLTGPGGSVIGSFIVVVG